MKNTHCRFVLSLAEPERLKNGEMGRPWSIVSCKENFLARKS